MITFTTYQEAHDYFISNLRPIDTLIGYYGNQMTIVDENSNARVLLTICTLPANTFVVSFS